MSEKKERKRSPDSCSVPLYADPFVVCHHGHDPVPSPRTLCPTTMISTSSSSSTSNRYYQNALPSGTHSTASTGSNANAPSTNSSFLNASSIISSASTGTASASNKSILDDSLTHLRGEVNLDVYLLLFSEMVSYCRDRVESVVALQEKLSLLGYRLGRRVLDLVIARDKLNRREIKLLNILNFIVIRVWTFLYGRQADSLKKVRDSDSEYYIEELKPLVNKYISVPSDYGHFNCASFTAGIINGVLDASGFKADVTAKILSNSRDNASSTSDASAAAAAQTSPMTIYYIKFDSSVLEREQRLNS